MLTSLFLASQFLVGIVKRLIRDSYYRSLALIIVIILLIGTLFTWLVGGWPLPEALLYSVTTMSMNTPYSGPLAQAASSEMMFFHIFYTFMSVGAFIIFTIETGKTMLTTYEEGAKKMAERKAKKNKPE